MPPKSKKNKKCTKCQPRVVLDVFWIVGGTRKQIQCFRHLRRPSVQASSVCSRSWPSHSCGFLDFLSRLVCSHLMGAHGAMPCLVFWLDFMFRWFQLSIHGTPHCHLQVRATWGTMLNKNSFLHDLTDLLLLQFLRGSHHQHGNVRLPKPRGFQPRVIATDQSQNRMWFATLRFMVLNIYVPRCP